MLSGLPSVLLFRVFSFLEMDESMYLTSKQWKDMLSSDDVFRHMHFSKFERRSALRNLYQLTKGRPINKGHIASLCYQSRHFDFKLYHPTINLFTPEQLRLCCQIGPYLMTPFNFELDIRSSNAKRGRMSEMEYQTYPTATTLAWLSARDAFSWDTRIAVGNFVSELPLPNLFMQKILSFFILTNTPLNTEWDFPLLKKVNEYAHHYRSDLQLSNRVLEIHQRREAVESALTHRVICGLTVLDIILSVLMFTPFILSWDLTPHVIYNILLLILIRSLDRHFEHN